MKTFRELLTAVNYNYVLYAVAGISLLYVLTSPVLIDPIMEFCFGGIVPGTDIVLAPEVVLQGVAVILGLMAVAGLVYYMLHRRQKLLGGKKPGTTRTSADTSHEGIIFTRQGHAAGAAAKVARLPQVPRWQLPKLPGLSVLLSAVAAGLRNAVSLILRFIIAMMRWMMLGIRQDYEALVWLVGVVRRGAVLSGKVLQKAAIWCCGRAADARSWAVPHLERLDTWLELRYRAAARIMHRLLMRSEVIQVLSESTRRRSK